MCIRDRRRAVAPWMSEYDEGSLCPSQQRLAEGLFVRAESSYRKHQAVATLGARRICPQWGRLQMIFCVKLSINNHIVGLIHKKHIIRTCLMYHAACKVEFQPFKRLYSQLTFFNFLKIRFRIVSNLGCSQNRQNRYTNKNKYLVTNTSEPRMPQHRTWCQASRQSRTWYHTYVGIPDFRNRPVGVTALFSEPLVSHTNSKYFFPKTRLRF